MHFFGCTSWKQCTGWCMSFRGAVMSADWGHYLQIEWCLQSASCAQLSMYIFEATQHSSVHLVMHVFQSCTEVSWLRPWSAHKMMTSVSWVSVSCHHRTSEPQACTCALCSTCTAQRMHVNRCGEMTVISCFYTAVHVCLLVCRLTGCADLKQCTCPCMTLKPFKVETEHRDTVQ